MTPVFKPKKAFIHVPGFGVVSREDFNEKHTEALMKRAKKAGVDQNKFINQHLVIASYGDLDMFKGDEGPEDNGQGQAEDAQDEPKKKGKKSKKTDDELLEELIEKEQAEKA